MTTTAEHCVLQAVTGFVEIRIWSYEMAVLNSTGFHDGVWGAWLRDLREQSIEARDDIEHAILRMFS